MSFSEDMQQIKNYALKMNAEKQLEKISTDKISATLKNYENTYWNVIDYGFILPNLKECKECFTVSNLISIASEKVWAPKKDTIN